MKKHIIDTDELDALPFYMVANAPCYTREDVLKLIANSPQADDVLEQAAQAIDALASSSENKDDWTITRDLAFHRASEAVRALIVKPQADDVQPAQQQPTSNEVKSALLFCLYHHQGASSLIGQPIRKALGIGQYERLSKEQCDEAIKVQSLLGQTDDVRKDAELYQELIMAVGNKYPNETRHQTALRYIVERENRHTGEASQAIDKARE